MVGSGTGRKWTLKNGGRWEVALQTGRKWEVAPQTGRWEMRSWTSKQGR